MLTSSKYLYKHVQRSLFFNPSLSQRSLFSRSKLLSKSLQTQESFANGTSSVYMDKMYEQWRKDPKSVSTSWQVYFANIDNNVATPFMAPPTLGQDQGSGQVQQIIKIIQDSL